MTKPAAITSAYVPDLEQLKAWLWQKVKAMSFVELVMTVVSLIARMRDINTELTKRLAYLQRKRPRSETLERIERQLALPGFGASAAKRRRRADESSESKKNRKGRHPGRAALPADLERIPVINAVPPELRICPICGSEMTTVGHSICEILELIPARLVVKQRMDERVACPHDDAIVSAPTPPEIVERGKLGPTLIVEATADKFLEHTPIERQCERWARTGVDIAPQTLGRSVAAEIDLVTPIAALIHEQTREPGLLGMDSTSLPVLDPATVEGIRTAAITCWTNARWVSFFYSLSADGASVKSFLGDENLCRAVQCDGTTITNCIEKAGGTRPGCMSHGRRGFVDPARAGDHIALEALEKIAGLFEVEEASKLAGDNAEQRLKRRVEYSQPIVDDLRVWLDENLGIIPPKSALGKALGYLHRQWQRLTLFLTDGNIELTNNRRERELRRLVQGRKNWLFTWKDVGGERIAAILTILATCIAHDINPRAYLHCVTKLILEGWPQSRLRDLLPDRIVELHPELQVGEHDALPAAKAASFLRLPAQQ